MSDISHGDYCDEPLDEDGDCAVCNARQKAEMAYWKREYERGRHYSREEVEDAYSDPTERAKRDILLERLG